MWTGLGSLSLSRPLTDMCRFAAYHSVTVAAALPDQVPEGAQPTPHGVLSPATLLFEGTHSLYSQSWAPREMLSGTVNGDGLGVAWYSDGYPVRLLSDRPAWHTAHHRPLLESVASSTIVASVRNATAGLGVDESSVAPLVFERWTLTLNGYITNFRRRFMREFRAELPDDLYGHLSGSSDTETLFMLLVDRLRAGSAPEAALADVVAWVLGRVSAAQSSAQLNFVLTDGEGLWVTRTGSLEQSNSLYYNAAWKHAPLGVTIASEPLDAEEWIAVHEHSLVTVVGGSVSVARM